MHGHISLHRAKAKVTVTSYIYLGHGRRLATVYYLLNCAQSSPLNGERLWSQVLKIKQ
jgi:hypothetical protein